MGIRPEFVYNHSLQRTKQRRVVERGGAVVNAQATTGEKSIAIVEHNGRKVLVVHNDGADVGYRDPVTDERVAYRERPFAVIYGYLPNNFRRPRAGAEFSVNVMRTLGDEDFKRIQAALKKSGVDYPIHLMPQQFHDGYP